MNAAPNMNPKRALINLPSAFHVSIGSGVEIINIAEAANEVMRVIEVANTWQVHFTLVGECQVDIDSLNLRFDGNFLLGQGQFGKTIAQYKPSNVGA